MTTRARAFLFKKSDKNDLGIRLLLDFLKTEFHSSMPNTHLFVISCLHEVFRIPFTIRSVWKHLLPSKLTDCSNGRHSVQLSQLYWMPSTWGRGKSASWHRDESIKAFALIRVKDNLPRSWPVTSPSSSPLHLARALASSLTWVTAPLWRPPKVSTANGKKTRPSRL